LTALRIRGTGDFPAFVGKRGGVTTSAEASTRRLRRRDAQHAIGGQKPFLLLLFVENRTDGWRLRTEFGFGRSYASWNLEARRAIVTQQGGTLIPGSSAPAAADHRLHFIPARRGKRRACAQQHALEAFEQILLTSRAKFVGTAYSILRNKEDAEDAVQNALLSAYVHLRTFEGRAALRTWFTRIVLNAALMLRRKRKPSPFVPLADSEPNEDPSFWEQIPASIPDPEKSYGDQEMLERIDTLLAKMRPALRQAFTMTYYRELSHAEACRLLDMPTGTFKARLFRARRLVASGVSTPTRKLFPSTSRPEAQTPIQPIAA
jgi:RNA polymerase sigma-70 factor (ECF subfamily)